MNGLTHLVSKEVAVLVTAAMPVIELRGAIPVGMSLGMSPWEAFALSLIGSMMPAPFLLLLVRPLFAYLRQTEMFRSMVDKLSNRTLAKSGNIQKYGFWGLLLFVAVPLPGTGVWTGTLAATLLGMRFKSALAAIWIGDLIAGLAVMTISHGAFSAYRLWL